MKRLALLAGGLAALAACSSGPSSVGARFTNPSAIVQFYGYTRNNQGPAATTSGLQPYLAVADALGGDVRLLDPSVDQPILGPGVIYPLSVVTQPRPTRLAAASIGDGAHPDALVVASAGSRVVQVIETWSYFNRVAYDVDLSNAVSGVTLPVDAEITGMVGLTTSVPDPTDPTGVRRIPVGRVLVFVTGQQLFVLDFARDVAPSEKVVLRSKAHQQLTFDPVDLAVGPDATGAPTAVSATAGTTVYAATRDALTGPSGPVHGVVELAAGGDPTLPFPTWVYDAKGPTVAVAAAAVAERVVSADPCAAEQFAAQRALRVYAAIAPEACGTDQPVACGLATLTRGASEAAGHLVPDLAAGAASAAAWPGYPAAVPTQAFRAPMPIAGYPLHVAVAQPPAKSVTGGTPPPTVAATDGIPSSACPSIATATSPLARVFYYSGTLRAASALAMVTATDGNVYWYDLSRSTPVVNGATLTTALTSVLSASSDLVSAGQWQLGLWKGDQPVSSVSGPAFPTEAGGTVVTPTVVVDALNLPTAISVWPGFTPGANWTAVYQGALPGLMARPGIVAVDASGAWVGISEDVSSQGGIADPARGVRAADEGYPTPGGDLVSFDALGCTARVAHAAVGPTTQAGVAFPGGALRLDAVPACLAGVTSTQITIFGADVVVSSDLTGYAGRAPISYAAGDNAPGTYFTLAWQDESTFTATDRPTQERLALARRARRLFYPAEGPCPLAGAIPQTVADAPSGCYSAYPLVVDPLAPGPALRFRVGLRNVTTPTVAATAGVLPAAGSAIRFATQSGLTMSSRRPTFGGTPPATLVAVDPGDLVGHGGEDFRFYVAYQDDVVIWFSTSGSGSQVVNIR